MTLPIPASSWGLERVDCRVQVPVIPASTRGALHHRPAVSAAFTFPEGRHVFHDAGSPWHEADGLAHSGPMPGNMIRFLRLIAAFRFR